MAIPITPPRRSGPPQLIAFAANAMGAGKTTAALHLVGEHGFVRMRFADTMKTMVRVMLDRLPLSGALVNRMIDGDLKEQPIPGLPFELTPRHMMQTLGTEWGRNCLHEDIWVMLAIAEAKRWLREDRSVVIDDMRFPNELAAVRNAGGSTVFIERPAAQVSLGHASEGQIKRTDCDYCIYNGDSVPAFQLHLDRMLQNLPHLRAA